MVRTNLLLVLILVVFPFGSVLAQKEAEVIHWWVAGGERAALQTVIDAFEAGGNTWVDTPVESSFYAKSAAVSRILDGKPPAAVQWQAGVSLKEMYREGLFRDIDELANMERWQEVVPKAIWDNISVDGKVVAVPITLHGSNWIWANKKILDEVGIGVPESWEEFLLVAPRIAEAGYYPLALGGQPWQERALFLPVVIGVGGIELYKQALVLHDPKALSSPEMIKALETFRALKQYIDPESPGRSWPETTRLIIEGKAAFQVMGDWVKGEFFQAGMVPGKDFLCALSPGSRGTYILVTDTFAMGNVTDKAVRSTQLELARVIMDKDVQKRFNLLKGSISPRIDVAADGFDPCARIAMATVAAEGASYPGFNMANTGLLGSGLMSVITRFWNDPTLSPEAAAELLAKAVVSSKL